MIKRYLDWLKRRQDARLETVRNNGYDFAVGVLLRSEMTYKELFDRVYDNPFRHSLYDAAFYNGCGRAMYRLVQEGIINDED